MDARFTTPLYDLFRRGEVARDIRILAARGVLAPRAHEQLALLLLLFGDSDPLVRDEAERTLARIPTDALASFLARDDVPDEWRAFFGARGIVATGAPCDVEDAPLFEAPDDAGDGDAPAAVPAPAGGAAGEATEEAVEGRRMAMVQRLSLMSVTDKVKTAMRGSREARSILIRDPNKLVSIAVLSSPKLTEQEVEGYAKMASVSEDVLRVIGTTRAWVKDYAIVNALCHNPKTPIALSLTFVKRLIERDVKSLVTDRNLPEPLRIIARKMTQAGEIRRA